MTDVHAAIDQALGELVTTMVLDYALCSQTPGGAYRWTVAVMDGDVYRKMPEREAMAFPAGYEAGRYAESRKNQRVIRNAQIARGEVQ